MKSAVLSIVLALAFALACAREKKITPAGPAVPDQLRSRGYITTPQDTVMPRDSSWFKGDSLRK
jgi:hypothetical protein